MRRGTWFNNFAAEGKAMDLPAQTREELEKLDDALYAIWNLGDNVLLGWTHGDEGLRVLSVRHYAIPEAVHGEGAEAESAHRFISDVLSGPKYMTPEVFARTCQAFGCRPETVRVNFRVDNERLAALISDMVRCYGVSLVRNRAVMLLDAVQFSLQSPLDQLAMLNSLSYSVNSAYGQLLSKDIKIDFARTTTGDGFYIWNRATTPEANKELYKLMMMILADNAVAQSKSSGTWVPKLRAAFHVGDHYEFHQVDGLSPTSFSYIVGQVTVDLSRMVDRALPGQILLGDFSTDTAASAGNVRRMRHDTLDFVESTAATLDQLNGLDISGGRIQTIRCYLTGRSLGEGRYLVNRYHLKDKHGTNRTVYNAKINIHRDKAEPIFLGIQSDDLWAFNAARVESINRDAAATASFFIRP
ncbi:MAG TPA: hypothetical protein VHA15_06225 [Burkholderiales bacterium]|jgi:hypothetical protein|nr:hypothetical protein [Burkholderiales bacterium]